MTSTNPQPLKGKSAIVTAGTLGIGYAIAERLASDGANVFINSRNEKNVNDAVNALKQKGYNVYGLVGNMGNPEIRKKLIDEAVKKFNKIDILVSNVAVNPVFGMLS